VLGVAQPKVADLPLAEAEAARFVGDYDVQDMIYGFERLGVLFDEGRLKMQIGGCDAGGPILPLLWQGGGAFLSILDDEQRLDFEPGHLRLDYFGGEFRLRRAAEA
jgi:hypothetical protein